jgi:hypothetical protein
MLTIPGKSYAHILSGIVHWIFTESDLPEFNADTFTAVDITNLSPQPAIGWTATETNGVWSFVAPVVSADFYGREAASLLTKSDVTVLRCLEKSIAIPSEWMAYRIALRAIVAFPSIDSVMPTRPAYPVGS